MTVYQILVLKLLLIIYRRILKIPTHVATYPDEKAFIEEIQQLITKGTKE